MNPAGPHHPPPYGSQPPPPTPAPGPPGAPPPPKPIGRTWIIAAAVTAAVAAISAVVISWRGGSEPDKGIAGANPIGSANLPPPLKSIAADHAPAGCDVLVRIDTARLLAARAGVTHLFPVLDQIATGGGAESLQTRRTSDFLRASGIDPRRDVGEVLICAASLEGATEEQRLALVFAGSLRPEALVAAVVGLDTGDAGNRLGTFDGRRLARTKSRRGDELIVGQAADGAMVVSNDAGFFESAVKTNKNAEEVYRLPTQPEVAVVVVPDFFQRPSPAPEGPFSRHRNEVRRMTIIASLLPTGGARGELRAATRDAAAAEALRTDGAALLDGARDPSAGGLEKALLADAKLRVDGADVVLDASWTEATVEETMKSAARGLRDAFEKGALAF